MAGRVLILGAGGREHALAWALARSASVEHVIVAPGNAGCSFAGHRNLSPIERATPADLSPERVVELVRERNIDWVVIGPERPLVDGVADALRHEGKVVFGPSAAAAQLEGSKAFMKQFAARRGIPTSPFFVTDDIRAAGRYIEDRARPVVVKTDGLASGKGAIVTSSPEEAKRAAHSMLV
ncbi:MAG: phosphoribosylamine--glycine ligase, partial [Myxococcota bacterium]